MITADRGFIQILGPDFGFCLFGSSDRGSQRPRKAHFLFPKCWCHAVEKMTRNSKRTYAWRVRDGGLGLSWFFWADRRIRPLILADRRIYIPLFNPLHTHRRRRYDQIKPFPQLIYARWLGRVSKKQMSDKLLRVNFHRKKIKEHEFRPSSERMTKGKRSKWQLRWTFDLHERVWYTKLKFNMPIHIKHCLQEALGPFFLFFFVGKCTHPWCLNPSLSTPYFHQTLTSDQAKIRTEIVLHAVDLKLGNVTGYEISQSLAEFHRLV